MCVCAHTKRKEEEEGREGPVVTILEQYWLHIPESGTWG